eukprot:m.41206 g.41206  ORF g.41206 m.41206 type:complete len:59 (-) comp10524_c0_seq2:574-750(-)
MQRACGMCVGVLDKVMYVCASSAYYHGMSLLVIVLYGVFLISNLILFLSVLSVVRVPA